MDSLPDGGPLSVELDRRGIDIGRDSYLDWTLPDPARFISGKHCEVRYRDGGYWLHDVSTNGTSVNTPEGRMTEPQMLKDGDRIHIGQYIIAVSLTGADAQGGARAGASSGPGGAAGADPWGGIEGAADTVSRRDFRADQSQGGSGAGRPVQADVMEEDFSWAVSDAPASSSGGGDFDFDVDWASPAPDKSASAPAPQAAPPPPPPPPPQDEPEVRADLGLDKLVPEPESASEPVPGDEPEFEPAPEPEFEPEPEIELGPAAEVAPPPESEPVPPRAGGLAAQWNDGSNAPAASPPPQADTSLAPSPVPSQPAPIPAGPTPAASGADWIAAFERGAGLPAGAVSRGKGDVALAEELGALFLIVSENLKAMLMARDETKNAMRSSHRTMIQAMENNPLKFSPTAEDAMRIMFGDKMRSYLDARQTLEASFGDLKSHQLQTFTAMQQALQALIEDLDPDRIAENTASDSGLAGLVGSRRAKLWDTYVERFKAKSARHERGMIDAFMILFAEMYDRQGR